MSDESTRLAQSAREAARSGSASEAEKLYQQLLKLAPEHIGALSFLSFMAKGRGELKTSRELLIRALDVDQNSAVLWRNLGILDTDSVNHELARSSFEKALELDPGQAINHLYLADTLEALELLEPAIRHYLAATTLEPGLGSTTRNPEISRLLSQVSRARVKLHTSYHAAVLAELADQHHEQELARVRDFVAFHHRHVPFEYAHPLQRPAFQYFPGLEPKPWFDAKEFEWVSLAESKTEPVRHELLAIFNNEEVLSPYIAHQGKVPDEWIALTNSSDWSAYHIYKEGKQVPSHCKQCPETTELLQKLPLVVMPGQAPEAFFSILRPDTHIPPHFGLANLKLAVHLPLVIPENCEIRVGDETRQWEPGRCMVFDDSFEHEAWNRSTESRAVLIFEVWNPQLTEIEKDAMSKMTAATVKYHEYCKNCST